MSARRISTRLAIGAALSLFLLTGTIFGAERVIDPCQLGAKPDGTTLCTQAIQKAIDLLAEQGGGTVRLGPGKYLSGTIRLKSHVTLQLEADARLVGSPNLDDYVEAASLTAGHPGTKQRVATALIVAERAERVAIRGQGTIDGNGTHFRDRSKPRPKGLMFVGCREVLIEGVSLEAAGSWMQHYRDCDNLVIRGIRVFNHVSYNNDGLDVDGCRNVVIADCTIDSDDDAVCLKSLSLRPCRNVAITNCTIRSHCNAIKMGTESGGGFMNVVIHGCRVASPKRSEVIYGKQRGLAGIALEIVDGGRMDAIAVSDVQIEGVTVPIFLRLGNRARQFNPQGPKPGVGTLKNVTLSKIVATGVSAVGCSITGLPEHRIENVALSDIRLTFEGGATLEAAAKKVPERPEAYPESTMYGTLPAYGFYCRHVKNLSLENVVLRTERPDQRHALVLDDAENVRISGLDAQYAPGGAAPIRQIRSQAVQVIDSKAEGAPRLLEN
jgi:hypothetical protein